MISLETLKNSIKTAKKEIFKTEAFTKERPKIAMEEVQRATEHLFEYLTSKKNKRLKKHLDNAYGHSLRAINDAINLRFIYYLNYIKKENNDLDLAEFREINPEFEDSIKSVKELVKKISDGKEFKTEEIFVIEGKMKKYIELLQMAEDKYQFKKKVKHISLLTTSWILLVIVALSSNVLITKIFNKESDTEIQNELKKISDVQQSILNIQKYLDNQKNTLQSLSGQVTNLELKKKQLDSVVTTQGEVVEGILKLHDNQNRLQNYFQIIVGFILGILGNMIANGLFAFKKYNKEIKVK